LIEICAVFVHLKNDHTIKICTKQ